MKNLFYASIALAMFSYFPAILSYYRIFYFLVTVVFCLALVSVWAGSIERGRLKQNGRWLWIFFGYLAVTALWAASPQQTLLQVAIDLIFILVWVLAYLLQLNFEEKDVAQLFLGVPYVVALTFAYLWLRFGALRPYDAATTDAFGATANLSAQWLVVALPFILWLLRRGDKKRILELILTIFLIAVSQSRTGYFLAAFCVLAEIGLRATDLGRFLREAVKWAALLTVLMTLILFLPTTRELLQEGVERTITTETADRNEEYLDLERVWMLEEGWNAFLEHPILGIGYSNVGGQVEAMHGELIVSHNILITLIAESGWPGLVIFVFLMMRFFKKANLARKQGNESGYYSAAIVSMCAALLSGLAYPLFEFPLFYFVLAIGYAAKGPESLREKIPAQALLSAT